MKKEEYFCDWCNLAIDGSLTPETGGLKMAGGGELCILSYNGIMGHNKFYTDKHYHYVCFCEVVRLLNKEK